ncbi:MAG: acylphosphatase [Chlorobiaceae bacterium]|nr:acylphosphatase [Chlorobiaceae bacterium]
MEKRMNLIVCGLVQGVGFRMFIEGSANELCLHGWVRNRIDGSVEIEVQGREDRLEELVKRAGKGPSRAHVTSIKRKELDTDLTLCGFSVLR